MRLVTIFLLACSLALSGCSYLLVKTPSQDYSPSEAKQRPLCTRSSGPPITDLLLITGGLVVTGTSLDSSPTGGPIVGLGMIGGGVAGSIYGFNKTSNCRTLDKKFKQQAVASAESPPSDSDASSPNTDSPSNTGETEPTQRQSPETDSNTSTADDNPPPSDAEQTAADDPQTQPLLDRIDKHVTITASLLDPLDGLFHNYNDVPPFYSEGATYEGMVEVNLPRKFAVSAFVGRGSMYLQDIDTDFARLRYGIQGLWYPIGDFKHGLQLGVHFQRNRAFGPADTDNIPQNYEDVFSPSQLVSSTSLAPMFGYKVMSLTGFTFNLQAGVGPRILQQNVADRAVGLRDGPKVTPFILGNLNLGWSF